VLQALLIRRWPNSRTRLRQVAMPVRPAAARSTRPFDGGQSPFARAEPRHMWSVLPVLCPTQKEARPSLPWQRGTASPCSESLARSPLCPGKGARCHDGLALSPHWEQPAPLKSAEALAWCGWSERRPGLWIGMHTWEHVCVLDTKGGQAEEETGGGREKVVAAVCTMTKQRMLKQCLLRLALQLQRSTPSCKARTTRTPMPCCTKHNRRRTR